MANGHLREAKHIAVVNVAAGFGVVITIFYSAAYAIVDFELFLPIIVANFLFAPVYLAALLCSRFQRFSAAAVLIFVGAFPHVAVDMGIMGRDSGIGLFFIAIGAVGFIAFPEKANVAKTVVVAAGTLFFLATHFLFPEPYIAKYPNWIPESLFVMSAVSTFAVAHPVPWTQVCLTRRA